MATPTTPSSHGGHGEHYGWRVRGGGLQPLAGVLQQYQALYPGAMVATGNTTGSLDPAEGSCYHRNRPPFSRGIP
jgi:hypothetical protein